jgi:hypothetical protein
MAIHIHIHRAIAKDAGKGYAYHAAQVLKYKKINGQAVSNYAKPYDPADKKEDDFHSKAFQKMNESKHAIEAHEIAAAHAKANTKEAEYYSQQAEKIKVKDSFKSDKIKSLIEDYQVELRSESRPAERAKIEKRIKELKAELVGTKDEESRERITYTSQYQKEQGIIAKKKVGYVVVSEAKNSDGTFNVIFMKK